jgi:hypothetical protein
MRFLLALISLVSAAAVPYVYFGDICQFLKDRMDMFPEVNSRDKDIPRDAPKSAPLWKFEQQVFGFGMSYWSRQITAVAKAIDPMGWKRRDDWYQAARDEVDNLTALLERNENVDCATWPPDAQKFPQNIFSCGIDTEGSMYQYLSDLPLNLKEMAELEKFGKYKYDEEFPRYRDYGSRWKKLKNAINFHL